MIEAASVHTGDTLEYQEGIWVEKQTRSAFSAFEDDYIKIRDKEHRIFSVPEIRQLPRVKSTHPHAEEWAIRARSIDRFCRMLKGKKVATAMDIGCGTGFFANILSQYCKQVVGVDVNLTELRLAAEAFAGNDRLHWYYADIINNKVFRAASFDLITFCCSFQYFADVQQVLDACFYHLRPGGSVHIIDTPFYENDEQERAQKATRHYYQNMGFDGLAAHYFHHTLDQLKPFQPIMHYKKGKLLSFFAHRHDSPFPWIEIIKPQL
ncbi:MAG: class I SAM-dependent methyltransferase [Sphingobacteriales bacterium]|nr:MAG: class I SAM-dependent methyltransferase [Sphingobacteriales bacterium]